MQTGGMETRVVFISFGEFAEVDEGKCDDTSLTIAYGLDVMFGIVEKRKDNTNSFDDFVAYVMRAGASFKADRGLSYPRNRVENQLLQTAQAAREEKTDFATVHRINLSLAIVIDLSS
jgi:hypothetical protein